MDSNDVITLEPITDPRTGQVIYQDAPRPPGESVQTHTNPTSGGNMTDHHGALDWNEVERAQAAGKAPQIINGELVIAGGTTAEPGQAVTLTDDRFAAGDHFDWGRAEHAQNAGHTLQIVNGELVAVGAKPADPGQSVTLTDDRFATADTDNAEVLRLVRSGTASKLIDDLRPTSQMRAYLPHDPGGWYLRTKPTPSHRDVLHSVIVRKAATGLYHALLWRFMQRDRGELKNANLNRWVGTHDSLSAHHTHLYPGRDGEAATLCLSQRTTGGMPTLTGTILQCAKWADGMGFVVRGGTFPYRQ